MNREETKQAVEVMQAWLDGKDIEYRYRDDYDPIWYPMSDDDRWAFLSKNYRIKRTPREWWMDMRDCHVIPAAVPTDMHTAPPGYIRVREVIE